MNEKNNSYFVLLVIILCLIKVFSSVNTEEKTEEIKI
jgi:hypothetical protein